MTSLSSFYSPIRKALGGDQKIAPGSRGHQSSSGLPGPGPLPRLWSSSPRNDTSSSSKHASKKEDNLQGSGCLPSMLPMLMSMASISDNSSAAVIVSNKPSRNTSSSSSSSVKTKENPIAVSSAASSGVLCCDKCDGKHETSSCPYFKKERDVHPDAQRNFYKKMGGASLLPGAILKNAKEKRQPGDGSCLFHSMSYGLSDGSTASSLRSNICDFISKNPKLKICETPLSDWVKWDSNESCLEYAKKMSRGAWGGGIEMAACSIMKNCNIHVYQRSSSSSIYKRISAFDHPDGPEKKKIVRVLYQGNCHYDALVA